MVDCCGFLNSRPAFDCLESGALGKLLKPWRFIHSFIDIRSFDNRWTEKNWGQFYGQLTSHLCIAHVRMSSPAALRQLSRHWQKSNNKKGINKRVGRPREKSLTSLLQICQNLHSDFGLYCARSHRRRRRRYTQLHLTISENKANSSPSSSSPFLNLECEKLLLTAAKVFD